MYRNLDSRHTRQKHSCKATQKPWDTEGIQLTGSRLMSSCLPHLIQVRLRQHSRIAFRKQVSLSESLAQERRKAKGSFLVLFLNKQLEINIPKSSFRVVKFGFPLPFPVLSLQGLPSLPSPHTPGEDPPPTWYLERQTLISCFPPAS